MGFWGFGVLKYDFISSKKGRRLGTILLEKKPKGGAKHLVPDQHVDDSEIHYDGDKEEEAKEVL